MALIPVQRSDGTYGYIAPDKQFYTNEEAFAKFPTTVEPQEQGLADQIQQVADDAIQSIKNAGNSAINASYDFFANTNADYNASLANTTNNIGVNYVNLFESNKETQQAALDAVNKNTNRPDWDTLKTDSPNTYQELSKPEVMAVAHDDIPKMSAVETIANTLAKSYQLGDDMSQLADISRKLKKNNQSIEDAADEDRQRMIALQKHIAELQKELPTSPWSPSGLVSTLTQMIPTVVNGIGTVAKRGAQYGMIGGTAGAAVGGVGMIPGLIAGGAAGAGAGIAEAMAHQEEGMTYLEGLQSGATKAQARRGANIAYVGNLAFNAPIWGGLFNPAKIAMSTGLLKQLGVETLENSFLGALGAASSVAGRNVATNTEWTMKDVGEMLSGGIDTIPITLALGGPKYGFAALHKLGSVVDASKVTTRDPDMMASHVNQVVKDTPMDGVTFDASQLADDIGNMTVEEGMKTAQRLKIDNDDFAAQVATGGDVTVSTGDFSVLPEETRNKLLADARVAGDKSARELQADWEAEQANQKAVQDETKQSEAADQSVTNEETQDGEITVKVADEASEPTPAKEEKPLDYQDDLKDNADYDKAVEESQQEQPVTPEQLKAEQEYIKTRTAEIEQEVDAEPVYAAANKLKNVWEEDLVWVPPENDPTWKPTFNLQLFAQKIRKGELSDDAMNQIEAIAEKYGFTSADHLAQAILKSKPRDEEIKNRVAQATTAIKDVVGTSETARQEKRTVNEGSLKKTAMELSSMAESIVNGAKEEAKDNPIRGKKGRGTSFYVRRQVYKAALKTFQNGNKAVSQAAKDNAFIYARIADRWAEVMRQAGKKDYTAADFAKAHPIVMGGQAANGSPEQRAFHGSPYEFEFFDLGAIGSGTGERVHGWGLYFAKNRKIADEYKAALSGTKGDEFKATIYEVEVPENSVLLNEELEFSEQSRKVKAALRKIVKNLTDEELENAGEDVSWEGRAAARKNVLELLSDLDGQGIYNTLYDIVGGDKEASLRLNEYGVKGITYNERDGQCFVVFDDTAIQVIDKYNQQMNETRGAYDASTGAVHLFESADQSTFIHESAHMWLSEMESLSMQENAPQEIVRDMATLKDWLMYKPERVDEYSGSIGKEFREYAKKIEDARKSGDVVAIKAAEEQWMQERFARGFERYLAEGKAPTKELKRMFERFKQWLIGIYQDLKELGKEPPEEIQRIMDKMLVGDTVKETPTASNKRLAKLEAALKQAKKEMAAIGRWKDAEHKLVTDIEVGKATARGKRNLAKAKASMAKSKETLRARLQKKIDDLQVKIYEERDKAKAKLDAQKEQTKQKVADQKEKDAQKISSLQGERDWYAAESKDYRAKRIARNSEYSVTRAKQVARDLIAKVSIRQAADWRNYSKLAKKCRDISERAYRKGDYQTALTWKNKEVINHAMAMEALKYEKQFLKGTQFLRKLQKLDKQKFNTQEDFDQVGALLERFGVERPDYDKAAKQETLAQWAERNQNLTGNVSIDDWLLDESVRKDYGDLMPDDFDSLIKALRNMRTVSNLAKKTMAIEKGVDIYTLQQYIIEDLGEGTHKNKDEKTWKDAFIAGVTDLKNMDTWLTNLVGENSTLYHVLCNNVWDAYNQEGRMVRRIKEGYDKIWNVYSRKERKAMQKLIYVEDMGVSVTKQNMIGVAMNLGTEGNMAKLLSAVPVDFEGATKWDAPTIFKMLAENLTEKDWKAVQGTWDLLETMWPDLAANHKNFVGFAPDKIPPQVLDVKTADGKILHLRGGYAPLKVDRRAALVSGDAMDANAPLYSNRTSPMILATKKGFTKSRTNAAYTVDIDPDVITQHLLDVAHDICFRGVVSDMNRIFNKDVRQALKNKTGDVGVQYLDDYLKELVGTPYREAGFDGINIALRWMRKAATTSAIALRPGVIIQNFANIGLYANAVKGWGHMDVIGALVKQGACNYWVKSAFNWRKARALDEQIYNLSPYMYDRKGRPDYALRDIQGGVFGNQYNGVRDKISEFASTLMMVTDDLTAKPMWLGAYEKELRRTGDQQAAVDYADLLIRRTIGSGRRIDQSPFMRTDPISVKGSMNIFYGFFNNEFNRWSREFHVAQQSITNVPGFLAFIAGRAIIFNLGGLLLAGQGPDKDESWIEWGVRNSIKYPLSLAPGMRDVLPGGIDAAFGRQTFGYRASVINSGLSTAYSLFNKTGKLVAGDGKTKKTARQKANQKQSLAETIAKLSAFALRYPDQFNAWFFNAYDYWANGMNFEAGDLIRRRPYDERPQNKKKG